MDVWRLNVIDQYLCDSSYTFSCYTSDWQIVQYAADRNSLPLHLIMTTERIARHGRRNLTRLFTRTIRVIVETLNYLDDVSKALRSFSRYNNVCSTFLKYNTPVSRSAPVEHRASSSGSLILMSRKNNWSNAAVKLMLKTNEYVVSIDIWFKSCS